MAAGRFLPVVLLATLVAMPILRSAAQQSAPPTFRSNIDFVSVDAIVTERDGRPITDLREADFQLFEDGKPQRIEHFKVVHVSRFADADSRPIETSSDEAREAARDDVRMFVIAISQMAFDCPNIGKVKEAIRGFMRAHLYPSDIVAVVEIPKGGGLGEFRFTRDPYTIESAIRGIGDPMRDYAGPNFMTLSSGVERYMRHGPDCKYKVNDGSRALQELAVRLSVLRDGRKSIVYVGGNLGGPMLTLAFHELITTLNHTNTALYVVDTGGLPAAGAWKNDARETAPTAHPSNFGRTINLRAAAEATGGLAVVNTNNYDANLKTVANDATDYYLLGYNSDAPHDGKFHDIDVRVRRPGAHIRSRAGFLGISPEPAKPLPKAPDTPAAVLRALGELAAEVPSQRVRAWVGTKPSSEGRARVTLAWEPVAQSDPLERRYVSVVALDDRSAVVFRMPEEGRLEPFGGISSRRGVSFDATPGRMKLRVAITDPAGSVLDSQTIDVEVPDATMPPARMSAPWVLKAANARELRLIDEDPDALPVAGRLFSRTDHLVVRFDRIGGGSQTRARLINRSGQPMRELPVTAAAGGARDQIDLPLNTVPPGEYLLEIGAGETGDARTLIAFRVRG